MSSRATDSRGAPSRRAGRRYAIRATGSGSRPSLSQKAMGHASITVRAHTYADLFDDELDNVAAALDPLDDLSRAI